MSLLDTKCIASLEKLFKAGRNLLVLSLLITISLPGITQDINNSPTPENYKKAVQTFYKLDQSNNYTESLSYADMNVLPLGLKQTISNVEVSIAVSNMRFETTYTELTVFARVIIPQHSPLFFGAQGIKLSHTGDIIGDASLVLMQDYTIPIQGGNAALTLKGDFNMETGRAKELTYVSIDCQGFKEMGISADVEFPESLLRKVDEKGIIVKGERVKGSFKTIVKDWNDIIASISLPPFEINGLEGFVFSLSEAVFDFSDFRNDPGVTFSPNYALNYMIPGSAGLWRGVYARDITITLPKQFSENGGRRVSFAAHDMLIDNNGITGVFEATNVLSIDKGNASGWRFSVNSFSLGLEANQLIAAGFAGEIGLPVGENAILGYEAIITSNNEYLLKAKSLDTLSFDIFKAKATILPNSYVELKVIEGAFKPEALLHGTLDMTPELGGSENKPGTKIANFKGIEFRSLRLKTESPRFTAEYFGYKGELKLMNFPVSIDRIGLRSTEDVVALGMDIKLTLSDNLFSGSTRIEVVGVYEEKQTTINTEEGSVTRQKQQWRYDKLNISKVAIDAKVAEIFTIKGELIILNDDPIYGDGFSGHVNLKFDKILEKLEVDVRAMFGRKDFRYWFVDARVSLPGEGIPAFPPLNLTGFGGGVSYRMKRDGVDMLASPTGARYVPAEDYGIGVKAAVLFNVANDAAINGEASFEIAFNQHGGVNFIGFYGYAKFLGKIPGAENIEKFVGDKLNKVAELEQKFVGNNPAMAKTLTNLKQYDPNKASATVFEASEKPGQTGFTAAVGIQYDFTQNSLHATFDLYVNALAGLVKGAASDNRAGWAVLHIDPNEWYVHMGTPTDRLGIKMGIGNILNVETGSYLMLGSRIPGSPPPPQQVADILGVEMDELDYMRDLNSLGDGRGFAFGSSLEVATGDITFLVLYANFQAGFGFDIMLKDYRDAQCEGRSGAIGIDGWYANGQAYVYLQGELGIKINLWFIKGKFPIIKGAAAALVQAMLPNPVYFRGYLAVEFSVLGGLVSGRCRFKFTVGEKCELVIPGGSPIDLRMISDVIPDDNDEDVNVFAAPQAAFTMRVGVPFDIQDDEGIKTYRIHLNEFSVWDGENEIPGKLEWTAGKDAASFYSHEILPPQKKLKTIVKVGFQVWKNSNWVTVYTAGQLAQEIMEVNFTTSTAPADIPLSNVEYSYPIVDQKFFLKDESKKGFIQLKRGQSYLFSPDYTHQVHIVDQEGKMQAVSFTYNTGTNRLEYTMPQLISQHLYSVNVVTLNKVGQEDSASPVTPQLGAEEDVITITTNQAKTVLRSDVGKTLVGYDFTTSSFGTLTEKINKLKKGSAVAQRLSSDLINLQYEVGDGEAFDLADLTGTLYSGRKPLVKMYAVLNDTYYKEDIYPLVYKNYPIAGTSFKRNTSILGVPPIRAIQISTAYITEIEEDNYYGLAQKRFPYIYNLPQIYKDDFRDIQHQVVNRFLGKPEQGQYNYLINGYYPYIRQGYYPVKLEYTLPDGTSGTTATFEFYNFIQTQ